MNETSKSPLDILLEDISPEKRESVIKAWHEHVTADPESIAARWALIHFSLVEGIGKNITQGGVLYAKFLEAREQLEKRGGELTSEFRLEDSRTAAKMADYLKVIEQERGTYQTRTGELEIATEAVRKAGSDASERIRKWKKRCAGISVLLR